jgi:hypothetical protein
MASFLTIFARRPIVIDYVVWLFEISSLEWYLNSGRDVRTIYESS